MKKKPYTLVLASASPRRHEILDAAGLSHVVRVSHADESSVSYCVGEPEAYVMALARLKGSSIAPAADEIILSADTVVYLPSTGEVLGKPTDYEDAFRMLSALSGSTHQVITGVCLRDFGGQERTFASVTEVEFRPMTKEEIDDYIVSASPYDKAGAYGIQEQACLFVRSIRGEYQNVVGLPITAVYEALLTMEEDRK